MIWWMFLACRADDPTSWITAEGDVSAAVVVDEQSMVAYVCGNSDATRDTFSRWFDGDWDGETFVAEAGGWTLTGSRSGSELELLLTDPEGTETDWLADGVEAAVYGQEETCRDGAIATEGRVDGAWCAPDGTRFQVEPVENVVLGESLKLLTPDGPRTFLRQLP